MFHYINLILSNLICPDYTYIYVVTLSDRMIRLIIFDSSYLFFIYITDRYVFNY